MKLTSLATTQIGLSTPDTSLAKTGCKRVMEDDSVEETIGKRRRIESSRLAEQVLSANNKRKIEDEEEHGRTAKRLRIESQGEDTSSISCGTNTRPTEVHISEDTPPLSAVGLAEHAVIRHDDRENPVDHSPKVAHVNQQPSPSEHDTKWPGADYGKAKTGYPKVLKTHVPREGSKLRFCTEMYSKEEIACLYEKIMWTEPVLLGIESTMKGEWIRPRKSKKASHPHYYSPLETLKPGYTAIRIHCENLGLDQSVADTARLYFHQVIISGQCNELNAQAVAAVCIGYASAPVGAEPDWRAIFLGLNLTKREKARAVVHLFQYLFVWDNYE